MSRPVSSSKREWDDDAHLDGAPTRTRGGVAAQQPLRRSPTVKEGKGIVDACRRGDVATVRMYYDVELVNVSEVVGESGAIPLVEASGYGHLEVVKFLIVAGCDKDLSIGDTYGTPLTAAAKKGHLEVVKYLLSVGCNKDGGSGNWSPLCAACFCGSIDVVRFLLSAGCRPDVVDNACHAPLHVASLNGRYEIVRCLVEAHCNVEVANGRGWTALHFATVNFHLEVMKYLVSVGCRMTATDKMGRTPLHLAKSGDIISYILRVDGSCEKEAKDVDGRTPLHLAAACNCRAAVEQLLASGCDTEAKDVDGRTPLHLAAARNCDTSVELLLDARCDKDALDDEGRSPLHLASSAGHWSMVKRLIQRNCSMDATDKYGWTPLFAALVERRYDVVRILEGDSAFEKRLVYWQETCSTVDSIAAVHLECDGLVFNDLGRLIRCDDTLVLPDESVLDCKTAIVRIVEHTDDNCEAGRKDECFVDDFEHSGFRRRCRALVSLSCLLRDGETVTLRNGRVLDSRACLVEAVGVVGCVRDRELHSQLLLRLGVLLRDSSEETIAVPSVVSFLPARKGLAADGKISGRECLLRALECGDEHYHVVMLYLGLRLGDKESIRSYDDELLTKKLCFKRGAEKCGRLRAWCENSGRFTVAHIRRLDEIRAKFYFQLGLLLLREENSAVAAHRADIYHHNNNITNEHDAASYFLRSLNGCSSTSAAHFYFGLAIPTSKSVELRARVSRDSIAQAIEIEDDNMMC